MTESIARVAVNPGVGIGDELTPAAVQVIDEASGWRAPASSGRP